MHSSRTHISVTLLPVFPFSFFFLVFFCDSNSIRQTFLKQSEQIKGSLAAELHTSHLSLSRHRIHVTKHPRSQGAAANVLQHTIFKHTHGVRSGLFWNDKHALLAWSANITKLCPECLRINTPQERIIPYRPHVCVRVCVCLCFPHIVRCSKKRSVFPLALWEHSRQQNELHLVR